MLSDTEEFGGPNEQNRLVCRKVSFEVRHISVTFTAARAAQQSPRGDWCRSESPEEHAPLRGFH